jgi:hypothetical protein
MCEKIEIACFIFLVRRVKASTPLGNYVERRVHPAKKGFLCVKK